MAELQLPPQVQDKLNQFRSLQQQLQLIALQKQQLIQRSMEIDHALKELEKSTTKEKIYRIAAPLFIETNKKEANGELTKEKSNIETRVKILEKQEKNLTEKLTALKGEVEGLLKGLQGGTEGAVVT